MKLSLIKASERVEVPIMAQFGNIHLLHTYALRPSLIPLRNIALCFMKKYFVEFEICYEIMLVK